MQALAGGSRAPWVIGNHDVPRPVSRYQLDEGYGPQMISKLIAIGRQGAATGVRRARAAALLQLALPGSAYIYQGEELGLPEVTDLPAGRAPGPEVPPHPRRVTRARRLPGAAALDPDGADYGFSETGSPAAPWLPQPPGWGSYSAEAQTGDPDSFLSLYRAALRLRREHPALGRGTLRWLEAPGDAPGLLCFARDPGFIFAANLGRAAVPLPPYREILLASEPDPLGPDGSLPPDTAVWLSA